MSGSGDHGGDQGVGRAAAKAVYVIDPEVMRLLGRSSTDDARMIIKIAREGRGVRIVPGSDRNGPAELSVEVDPVRRGAGRIRIKRKHLRPWSERNKLLAQLAKHELGQRDRSAAMAVSSQSLPS